ncbi:hypothetical protein HPP92_010392 [Vanilla planifolia]|uniref:Uncharacterized protein n=1 Tax=Vanilla planifolia TaxID=51239 RepID=A0A835R2A1_VANPL|nr:hypothetical protein HPP92_010684 [Vanilla planifolia]KAG0482308.1 hypothetical protein HPP92_010392 [Vanilla planifolia]
MQSGILDVPLVVSSAYRRSVVLSGAAAQCSFQGRDKDDKDDGVRRSAVSGKKILLKLEKSKEDKKAENNRNELLKFLNASYD